MSFNAPFNPLTPDEILAAHRRAHRSGRPAKIDTDHEVPAFILDRIDTETFEQITAAIRLAFPPHRHVGRSSIHRWWRHRETKGKAANRLLPPGTSKSHSK